MLSRRETYTRMEGMGRLPMSEDPVSFERYLAALLDRIVTETL
jgi:hypothetical protein